MIVIPKLGCDLDGVVFDTNKLYIEKINARLGTDYKEEDITTYSLEESFDISAELAEQVVNESIASGVYSMMRGANLLRVLAEMSKLGIIFISSRRVEYYPQTFMALANMFEFYFDLFVGANKKGEWGGKSKLINEFDIDIFIEDGPWYAEDIVENAGCMVLLFDQPYNQEVKESDKLFRMGDWRRKDQWREIYKFMEDLR